MSNAEVIDFSKYQSSRDLISEKREFEKYLKLLSLQDLLRESARLTNKLQSESLDDKLVYRCQTVINEINERMGCQVTDLNIAFHQIFKNAQDKLNELKNFQEL